MLRYLENEGALLPHVLPELLLTYEYYQIMFKYCSNLLTLVEMFNEEKFNAYSAQCYLDVILQSIKIFILHDIKLFDVEIRRTPSEDIEMDERLSGVSTLTPLPCQIVILRPNIYIYTKNEHVLLYWLQYHFDNQKHRLWKSPLLDELNQLKPKEIKLFEEDLNDSLVFACVTVAYCPYLTQAVSDMYVPPVTFEEHHHNACTIIKAWNLLRLSYEVDPDDIVHPNGINMMLLTLYLYEILPSFYPTETLTLQAKLTQCSKANINLTNSSEHQIVYSVSFFNNESESFSSETEVFRIPSKRTGVFKIEYQAKKISSQKAILILSGELPGQKYGRSRAIHLNGVTDLNFCTKQSEFKCECYTIYRMKIALHSPYNMPDTYEIFYAITNDQNPKDEPEELELYSWKEYILGKVPKRMYTREYEFKITNPEDGFIFEPIICCQMIPVRIYKMFLVGKHGDWCFEIRIVPKISKHIHEVINVSLPRGFNSQACSCREKSTEIPLICPRTIHINIPSKNNLFYKSTREMFIACTDEQFLAFWRKYLPIRVVFNILRNLFYADKACLKAQGYVEFLLRSHVYNVRTDVNSPFTAVKRVTIEDIASDITTDLLIHAEPSFDPNTGNYLELETLSGMEKRYYKLNFYES
ncbi:hypothetical protein HHI36_005233 [Cryptolaemus montrouzieri]|uniref:Cilia- and flagella-associated protein 47 domain-containing protein n=1 Tax=Cryptolaemus montrouzieri TaxID=559131 RepID=A0ABD2NTQ8_9CUCU